MVELSADDNDRDDTHFWVYCPGCANAGKIGVPHHHPSDAVVCPSCRQVVNIRPEDRILWRPAEATEFLRARFPHNDWDNIDREPHPLPLSDEPHATVGAQPEAASEELPAAVSDKPRAPVADLYVARRSNLSAVWVSVAAAVVAMVSTLVAVVGQGPPQGWERRDKVTVRQNESQEVVAPDAVAKVKSSPLAPPPIRPIELPPPQSPAPQSPAAQAPPPAAEPAPAPPPDLAWRELYEHARQRMKEGDYAEAVDDLNEVLRLKPDLTDALVQRMTAFLELRRYQEALADANRHVRLRPGSYQPLIARAVIHEALGNWRQVADDLDRAVRLADADLKAGGQDKARAALDRSQRIARDIYAHAQELFAEHAYAGAAELFTVLQRHRPDTAKLVFWRAACYEAMGAVDQALLDYNDALDLPSPPAWAYVRRAILHERKRDFASALLDLRKAVQLEPTNRDYIERLKRMESKRRYHPRMYPVRLRTYPVATRM